jgi:hypothetical protein
MSDSARSYWFFWQWNINVHVLHTSNIAPTPCWVPVWFSDFLVHPPLGVVRVPMDLTLPQSAVPSRDGVSMHVWFMHLDVSSNTTPLYKWDSINLLWSFKRLGTYLGSHLEPCTPESQNIDTSSHYSNRRDCSAPISTFLAILGEIPRKSDDLLYSLFIQWQGISIFSVSCLVNPDPTLGPGFVDFIFLHVNVVIASTVNYTLATILRPIFPGFCTSDRLYWYCCLLAHLVFALEIESSHGLEWF